MGKSVVGLDSLLKKLNKLGGNIDEVLTQSIGEQTKLVQGDAKDLCPVDMGDLRNSIKGNVKKYNGRIVGVVSTNSDHAAYVEFGTGKVGERTNKNTSVNVSYKQDKWLVNIPDVGPRWIEGQSAQPYLYPALKNNEERIIENIKADVRKAIREVAKK
ncbi:MULTISPECIES: HK97-gp10 family putative phage morphogenesis protein [unclassified Clostridium]|uniref:HK97-gp10 family putative phage morphogenesis protein n=1 Tax=unclassified Clostridium TaxID=2614128 RepID=UPI00290D8DBE|nr:HK97-gp10 family putative phage morphogenesis protein [Clostridium sp.]MDU5106529.1 HK97 gp10 family phage protein [Clostridium sp.]